MVKHSTVTSLVPMTDAEFVAYVEAAIPAYAHDKVLSGQWAEAESLVLARQEYVQMLPLGVGTPDQYLYTMRAGPAQEPVGVLWYAIQEQAGKRQAYVYDVLVHPEHQRQGHATRAFEWLEREASARGLAGIALHVFGHNTGARDLYTRLGFAVTNVNMFKPVAGAVAAGELQEAPALCTERLLLEPLRRGHAEEMFAVLADPAIYDFLDDGPPASVEALRDRYTKLETRCSADGSQAWLNWVLRLRGGEAIGYVQATIDPGRRCYVAYLLSPRYQGQGYATEAMAWLLSHLAEEHPTPVILAVVEVANAKSAALLRRLGFEEAAAGQPDSRGLTPSERLYVRPGAAAEERS